MVSNYFYVIKQKFLSKLLYIIWKVKFSHWILRNFHLHLIIYLLLKFFLIKNNPTHRGVEKNQFNNLINPQYCDAKFSQKKVFSTIVIEFFTFKFLFSFSLKITFPVRLFCCQLFSIYRCFFFVLKFCLSHFSMVR